MIEQTRAGWQPTDADVAELCSFETEILLHFVHDGILDWANGAALRFLGLGSTDDLPRAALTLDRFAGSVPDGSAGDSPASAPGGGLGVPAAGGLAPGEGTGPHVSQVRAGSPERLAGGVHRRPGGPRSGTGDVWWEWQAWRHPDGGLFVLSEDVSVRHQASADRSVRQQLTELLVEEVGAAIAVRALDGSVVVANRRYRRWFPDTPRAPGPLAPIDRQVATDGVPVTSEDEGDALAGRPAVSTVRFPLRSASGHVTHVASVSVDLAVRSARAKQATADERVFDTLVRVSPDVVALVDSQKQLVEVSDAVQGLLGLAGPATQQELARRIHRGDICRVEEWIDTLLAGSSELRCRLRLLRGDGGVLQVEISGRRVVDSGGRMTGAVLVARDVTAALDTEARLEEAMTAAQDASRAKSVFLSRVGLELRAPIETVLDTAIGLPDQVGGEEPMQAEHRQAVEHIERASRHLRALIDEMLDLARAERHSIELQLQAVPAARLVEEAVGLVGPLGDERGVLVRASTAPEPDGGPWVWADHQRLLQVLLNLLSNGVKYNRPQGTVRVSVSTSGPRVRVAVADTGLGIAAEDLPRLFEPFERLGAERSAVEGTGVGLALSRHLVAQMGGTIEVTSAVGTGSVFVVELAGAQPPAGPR